MVCDRFVFVNALREPLVSASSCLQTGAFANDVRVIPRLERVAKWCLRRLSLFSNVINMFLTSKVAPRPNNAVRKRGCGSPNVYLGGQVKVPRDTLGAHAGMYTYTYTHIHIYTYTYTHIHIYTYTSHAGALAGAIRTRHRAGLTRSQKAQTV